MQPVRGVQIECEHARLIKLCENLLKNHKRLWRVVHPKKLHILTTRSQRQFQGQASAKIASNYFSKYPNGGQSSRQLDSLKHSD